MLCRRGRASVAGIIAQPAGVNRRGLASGPWQSPGAGPPICCLRQLALEGLAARAIPLGPPLPGGRQACAEFDDLISLPER